MSVNARRTLHKSHLFTAKELGLGGRSPATYVRLLPIRDEAYEIVHAWSCLAISDGGWHE
jgi:hypothetical protein